MKSQISTKLDFSQGHFLELPVCQPENIIFTKKKKATFMKTKIILIFKTFFLFFIKKIN